jgi:hypothetical protein
MNWTIFFIIRKDRKSENRIPRIPISLSFKETSWAFFRTSGEILEKKSVEKGYMPSIAEFGSPRNRVNRKVKKVNKKSEENME